MPSYTYFCEANGAEVEVSHSIKTDLHTWGEVCAQAGIELGDTPAETKVERLLYAPALSMPRGNAKLKEMGFTKLVKRDDGVYENVTAADGEARYMKRGEGDTLPKFADKIKD